MITFRDNIDERECLGEICTLYKYTVKHVYLLHSKMNEFYGKNLLYLRLYTSSIKNLLYGDHGLF